MSESLLLKEQMNLVMTEVKKLKIEQAYVAEAL